ncbi:MAG TPA: Clp1/GlmU family protein [Azospirillaceae bacterium]|nr:Clp1/GlmU family protein [Azospirillaceae bacterium]
MSAGGIDVPGDLHVPADWEAAAARLRAASRILVLGPADAGKSSFCRYALSLLPGARLVDADPGQKSVGPPACVTSGQIEDGRLLEGPLAFAGSTDPVRGWQALAAGVRALADAAPGPVIVNTGGLLAGPGPRLKADKIAAAQADLLVAIGAHPGIEAVLADHTALASLRLASSTLARRKTDGERRQARREAFARSFAAASEWTVSPEGLLPDGAVLHPRQLVGLAGDAGDLGIGILTQVAADAVTVLGTAGPAGVRHIRPGLLLLDRDFRESALPR